MSDTRAALEAALAASPDDAAVHAAYADLLIESGDPRGEYIRLQLALEDRDQPADRLRDLEQRAFALRREHEADWLGPLDEFVNPPRGPSVGAMVADNVTVTWRRGWVDAVRIGRLDRRLRDAVRRSPATRLLAELTVLDNADGDRDVPLAPLFAAPYAATLRQVELGDWVDAVPISASDIEDGFAGLPRLETLILQARYVSPATIFAAPHPRLTDLRLRVAGEMPLAVLAANPTLGGLTYLYLADHPDDMPLDEHSRPDPAAFRALFRSPHLLSLRHLTLRNPGFGDDGVDELFASGMIARLRGLDLVGCDITDSGAEALAACPDVPKLEYLHLENNLLSPIGIDALARVGVAVSDRQMFGGGWTGEIPY